MAQEVAHDDDVTGMQFGHQGLRDTGFEPVAVDQSVEHHRRKHAGHTAAPEPRPASCRPARRSAHGYKPHRPRSCPNDGRRHTAWPCSNARRRQVIALLDTLSPIRAALALQLKPLSIAATTRSRRYCESVRAIHAGILPSARSLGRTASVKESRPNQNLGKTLYPIRALSARFEMKETALNIPRKTNRPKTNVIT